MGTWVPVETTLGLQPITEVSTTQRHPLGTRVKARYVPAAADTPFGAHERGVGEFIYLEGVASTVLGSVVTFAEDDFTTALITANVKGPVAVAMGANVADSYGWYQIYGKAVAVADAAADNADVYIDGAATVGKVDDATVAGDRVQRAKFASTECSGYAELEIQYPFCDDGVGGGS